MHSVEIPYPRWRGLAKEALVAVVAAAVVTWYGSSLVLNPLSRPDQVSAIASLALFTALVVLLPSSLAAFRTWSRLCDPIALGSAALAGASSAVVAGGIAIALYGTRCPVNGLGGDAGRLAIWAQRPSTAPGEYPPLPYLVTRLFADLTRTPEPYVLRYISIVLLAATGPALYIAWRAMYGPITSLVLGPVLAMVYTDPYKPYASIVLGLTLVTMVALVGVLSTRPSSWRAAIGFGAMLAALTLTYPGWLTWIAPGVALFLLFTLRWRSQWRAYIRFSAILIITWLFLCCFWLMRAIGDFAGIRDTFQYFDSLMRPTFFAFWQSDTPLFGLRLPQFGEFGGLDLYSLALILLMGLALFVTGRSRTMQLLAVVFAITFLRKLQLAGQMRESGLVQLFPRANQVLALVSLSMVALGLVVLLRHMTQWWSSREGTLAAPARPVGMLVLGILLITQGTVVADSYMPNGDGRGALTLNAHKYGCWPIPSDADPDVPK